MSTALFLKKQLKGKSRAGLKKADKPEQGEIKRKSLQTLQQSADNDQLLVGSFGMVQKTEKDNCKIVSEQGTLKTKPDKGNLGENNIEKENSPMMPRRSRRKPLTNSTLLPSESGNVKLEKLKSIDSQHNAVPNRAKNLLSKSKKNNAVLKPKSKMHFFCSSARSSTDIVPYLEVTPKASPEVTEGLKEEPNIGESCVIQVVSKEESLLVSDNVPDNYWMELAEQRRIALEKTLHENEMLRDQLEVLETENSKLTSMLKDAEKLALVVKDILGEP